MFCGRRENLGRQVQEAIRGTGGEATYQRADVRRESEVHALVRACVARYGRIDVAFNNAGIEAPPKTLAELTPEEYQNVIATNQFGVFYAMRHELPVMLQQKTGAIINTASVGGHRGFAMIGPYGASKAAVLQMTRIAALENADKNIRINSISPGAVDTPMLHRALASWNTKPEVVAEGYPIKRLSTAEEMARAVMYLASDEASIITGTDLDLTGGYLTR
jgi:NAD(P)-dependent dehydrogenase (short-subunit alcohol dehydrogenase family)